MKNTGTYDISTLLAARFQSPAQFGFERITEILRQDLAAWNARVQDQLAMLAYSTSERQGVTGSSTAVRGQEVDEYSAGHTKVERPGSTVAFPLRRLAYPVGWTRRWLKNAMAADMAIKQQAVQAAYLRDVQMYIKRAIYTSTNYDFRDINVDDVSLGVKAFHNADGAQIPDSPQDGTKFNGSTHTHYLANSTLDNASADSLINTVIEHSVSADIAIAINRADIAAWEALTGFKPAQPIMAVYRQNSDPDVPTTPLDRSTTSNKFIGQYKEADVWVKPWTVANYAYCWDRSAPTPLAFRVDTGGSGGLELIQELMDNPLTNEFYEAVFGVAVSERTNGAVLQFNNATYQNPVITG